MIELVVNKENVSVIALFQFLAKQQITSVNTCSLGAIKNKIWTFFYSYIILNYLKTCF